MMKTMKSLLAATASPSRSLACVKQDAAPEGHRRRDPDVGSGRIKLPEASRDAVGELADYYVVTRDVTRTFNGGSAWVLDPRSTRSSSTR